MVIPMEKEQILDNLKWSLQALALPAEVQITLFPNFACVPDELAFDFDHWTLCAVSNEFIPVVLSTELQKLNAVFDEMENLNLWTLQALAQSEEWNSVRRHATQLLTLMGWEIGIPPVDRAIYIKSKPD